MVIGQQLFGVAVIVLWYVIHLGAQARVAHREIVLGAVTRTVGALASGLAATFVALDKRPAQNGGQGRELAQQCLSVFAESGSGFVAHKYQTTHLTGPIIIYTDSLVNLLFRSRLSQLLQ